MPKAKTLPIRSFGPGGRNSRNVWEFEGWVSSLKLIETPSGTLMASIHAMDREPADVARRRKQGPTVCVRAVVFYDLAKETLDSFTEGDRVLLRGNFHNRRRGTRFGFLTKWVATEIRSVNGDPHRIINQWCFEGKVARDPEERMKKCRKGEKKLYSVGIWQDGITAAGPHGFRKTAPIIINPVALPGAAANQLMEFRKGEPVFVSGHFQHFIPRGMTQLIIDRCYPTTKEWLRERQREDSAGALGLLNL